jgi:hypothetical protein
MMLMAKKARKKAKKASRKKAGKKKAAGKASKKVARKVGKKKAGPGGGRKKAGKKARRTVLYSSKGKKHYAARRGDGSFKDIQSYQRAHSMDIARSSAAEREADEAQMSG